MAYSVDWWPRRVPPRVRRQPSSQEPPLLMRIEGGGLVSEQQEEDCQATTDLEVHPWPIGMQAIEIADVSS